MTEGIMPTMPLAPANQTDGNMGGGSWIWIILIVLLLGGRGGLGFGGTDGVAASPATNLINNDFLYTQQKVDNLSDRIVNQGWQIQQSLNTGFDATAMGLCNLGHQVDSGFCGVNRNIDQVRFESAQNTCQITNAIHDEGRLTRDLINSNTMQDLRDRNVELVGQLNNSQQTAAIIDQLRPYPSPSYLTLPPGIPFGGYPGAYGAPFGGHGCYDNCCQRC